MNNSDSDNLKQIWKTEQELLDVVHDICKKKHIRYSLFYGTLIGAVRHKGFIPWDDDIDLVMPRIEYERFIRVWKKNPPEGYILQDYRNISDYPNNFLKIRKDNTTFLQFWSEKDSSYHKGIFIDIFPADRVAPSKVTKLIQYFASAINLLYTREFPSGNKGIIGFAEKVFLKIPKKYHRKMLFDSERIITRWRDRSDLPYYCGCTIRECKKYFPHDIFDRMKHIEFNGKKYFCVSDADKVLHIQYGDYMQMPPVEERVWTHHPLIIDFERNYEDIPENEITGQTDI